MSRKSFDRAHTNADLVNDCRHCGGTGLEPCDDCGGCGVHVTATHHDGGDGCACAGPAPCEVCEGSEFYVVIDGCGKCDGSGDGCLTCGFWRTA